MASVAKVVAVIATQLFLVGSAGGVPASDTHLGTNNAKRNGVAAGWTSRALSTSRGGGVTTASANTVAGTTNGVEIDGFGVAAYEWISPPVSADVTISGTITANIWAEEINMSANVAINVIVDIIRANTLTTANSNTIVNIVQSTNAAEVSVAARAAVNFTSGMTSGAYTGQTLNRGDRLRIRIVGDDVGTMASGYSFTASWNGTSAAADGDTYVTFTENFSFESAPTGVLAQSDTSGGNNAIGSSTSDFEAGQRFTTGAFGYLTEVKSWLRKLGTPTDDLILEIQSDSSGPAGVIGSVGTISGATLTTTLTQYTFACAVALAPSTNYWLTYRRSGAVSGSNFYYHDTGTESASWPGIWVKNSTSGIWADFGGTEAFSVSLTLSGSVLYLTNTHSGLASAPALISSFTGSDENPLSEGGNWAILNSSTSALRRLSNAAVPSAASNSFSYWTPANFGPDVEVYVTLQTVAAAAAHRLFARIQGEGGAGTWDGYGIGATGGSANTFLLSVTNGTVTTLGATASASSVWASGDKLGIRCEGSTLQGWRLPNGGSSWELVVTAVDSTYPSAGKIGLNAQSTSAAFDDLYAATDSNLFTQKAWTSRGAGVVSYLSDTDAGWTVPLYTHDWYTPELQAFTLTGLAQANIRALESNASANASLRCELARVDSDGTNPTVWASWCCAPTGTDNGELTTSEVARTINVSGDDLAFTDGQRLRIRLYNEDISSAAMANAFNVQRFFNGTSGGASGDSYITLPQTVSEFGGGPTEFFHDPLRVMQAVNRSNVY